ncbi:MAG: signal recognition particle protein [Succinivibrionaceae bacterium]|nr:signal recognition particle protein [Succinivibrionaceae bacterium]
MFDNLTNRLNRTLKNLSGQGRITEDNVKETLREVRTALLEADVALSVVRSFTSRVKERVMGKEVNLSLTPGQEFIRSVYDELVETMGGEAQEINLAHQPPAVILLAGLQGAGKTTSAAKLALYLRERLRKKVLMASADVYRPAAIEQLAVLGQEVGVDCFDTDPTEKPQRIVARALEQARLKAYDVLIVDTAGRQAVDEAMMEEVRDLAQILDPIEIFFVVDAMTGQDAAVTAKAFGDALPLTGVILTKVDGDARGGAALSVKEITGKPIKFMGVGEKVAALEPFHPDRIASRILDMGDLLSLIESIQRNTDQEKAAALAKKITKGKGFTLEDFKGQLLEMKKMGGMSSLMDKLPGMGNLPDSLKDKIDDRRIDHTIAIINSMTPKERAHPELIKASRKRRISMGSGRGVQEVNELLRQFTTMQKVMKRFGKGGMGKMASMLKGLMGGGLGGGMGGGGFPNLFGR